MFVSKKLPCFDPLQNCPLIDLNGNLLNQDLQFITDIAMTDYKRFVLSKQYDVKYFHNLILIKSNETDEQNLITF